jgi:FkbM family methyltransferase
MVLWDIGANIGIWSLFLTSACTADAEITCFEPDLENLKFLQLNKDRNKIQNWTIRPLAVSNEVGLATFFSDPVCGATGSLEAGHDFIGKHYHARRNEYQVRITTVDAEVASGGSTTRLHED